MMLVVGLSARYIFSAWSKRQMTSLAFTEVAKNRNAKKDYKPTVAVTLGCCNT